MLHTTAFCLLFASMASAHILSDNDLLMASQQYGETRRDASVSGKNLSIGGIAYEQGIGTHATSMIPLSIEKGADALEGACGIDDGANGGSARFSIMSGSETLWKSELMKKGMPAQAFSVKIPSGAKKLYLLVDAVGNNSDDHADWVNLHWKKGRPSDSIDSEKSARISVASFGMKPGIKEDQGPALRRAISAARASGKPCVIDIPKGEYHLYKEGAHYMRFHTSNNDHPEFHQVCVPLVDLENVTLEGNGSTFIFHGETQPLLLMDSKNVGVNNLALDYERTFCSEGVVTATDDTSTTVRIDARKTPYKIVNNRFSFIGEGWAHGSTWCMAFEKGTRRIVAGSSDLNWNGHVEDMGDGLCKISWDLKEKRKNLKPGDTIAFRIWGRPHVACVVYRADQTVFRNFAVHQSMGMAILVQRSTDFTMEGGGVFIPEGSGRVHTAGADATHFSNTRGHIDVKNALFEGMMDDAINVHSTCLGIQEIIGQDTIRCKYMHSQAIGFETFLPGEQLRFIAGPTLEPGKTLDVKSVRKLNAYELLITLNAPLPAGVRVGDAVENASWYPSVSFTGNTVRNNRARGSLFTTPKKVVVADNLFDHSSGSAILLAGDAQGWYESGACEDVLITRNKFINNLTSRYQFTNAIIAIYPEVKKLDEQKEYYHRNVTITENTFDTFDVPLLFAISTKNLQFTDNTIRYNNDFKGWGAKPFEFIRCADVTISGNSITPAKTWTIGDCTLKGTPPDTVTIRP